MEIDPITLKTTLEFVKDIFLAGIVVLIVKYLDYKKDLKKNESETENKLIDAELVERKEFREEVDLLRSEAKNREKHYESEIKELQKQLDDWRDKYYKLFEKYTQLISSNSELKGKYHELMNQVNDIRGNTLKQ